MANKLGRLLLTGAAGGLGKVLRDSLKPSADVLRAARCVAQALIDLGVSVERPFEEVLEANFKGVFHLYEAARRHATKRIVFASSNHVIGFHRQTETIDASAQKRPDGYYGLSKSFGEDVAQFYFDRYGTRGGQGGAEVATAPEPAPVTQRQPADNDVDIPAFLRRR